MGTHSMTMLTGNITTDITDSISQSGILRVNFGLATNYRTRQGDDRTEYHNIVAFGRTAKVIRDYLTKGALLQVIGHNSTSSWEAKDRHTDEPILDSQGNPLKSYRTDVIADRVVLLGKGGASNGSDGSGDTPAGDDDIPF